MNSSLLVFVSVLALLGLATQVQSCVSCYPSGSYGYNYNNGYYGNGYYSGGNNNYYPSYSYGYNNYGYYPYGKK